MTLDTVHAEWATDAQLDFSRPDAELRKIPILHSKYWQFYTQERMRYVSVKQEHDDLRHAKLQWLLGRMDDEERTRRAWPPQGLRIVRPEAETFLAADADLMKLAGKLELQKIKLDLLEDIVKQINNRNYVLRNYIDYIRWSQGNV